MITKRETSDRLCKALVALATALIALASVARAQAAGRCYSASIPSSMILPGRSVQPPGTLKVCPGRALSPVEVLHKVYINGSPVGEYRSRTRSARSEGLGDATHFVFLRNSDDELMLQGYVVNRSGRMTIHSMGSATRVNTEWRPTPQLRTLRSKNVVLIASR